MPLQQRQGLRPMTLLFGAFAIFFLASAAQAQTAKKILERVAGVKVPGDQPLLTRIEAKVQAGDLYGAALIATEHPQFYNLTVKQMALKMSTREETIAQKLNDFAASIVGVTRDGLDARLLLTGDFHYRAADGLVAATDITRTNDHYAQLDDAVGQRKTDLGTALVRMNGQLLAAQTGTGTVANPDPAGVLTSRAFLGAHTIAGTNRRPVEYTFKEFMCVDMTDWSDTGSSDARVGRDIDRMPADDHLRYLTTCKGCHTGMDGFRGAFAKWDWQVDGANNYLINSFTHTDNRFGKFVNGVAKKMNGNATTYLQGFITDNSTWMNFARAPANNTLFGWRGTANAVASGTNVRQLGVLISNSKRFSQCMVKRTFEAVCRKQLSLKDGSPQLAFADNMASQFEQSNYKMKELFAHVAVSSECGR